MKRFAATALVVAAAPAPAAEAFTEGCQSASCHKRVTVKWGHRKAREKKRRVVAQRAGWLSKLRWCESTNNPRAVDSTGTYHGLYQFDLQTWRSVGGQGTPSTASRLEQGYRAVLLFRRRGTAPWPVCG